MMISTDSNNNNNNNHSNNNSNNNNRQNVAKSRLSMIHDQYSASENKTPDIAKIASIDYKLNGGRARSNTGDFVGPRWVVDLEVTQCFSCKANFNLINRRHHCRYCGLIYCNECTSLTALLPREFGMRDPQRVCQKCYNELSPKQSLLTEDIANHQRFNPISINAAENCSVLRYSNMPYSYTMGSELRKASYYTYNIFLK